MSALLPPVYSYLLAGIFKIFGIETRTSILAALSLNSVFSALTCIPVFLLARQAFGDRVAKWAGWGWAFSPYGVYYGADWAWSTCLVTLELACLFLMAWRLEDPARKRDWILFGVLCGLAALTEPVVMAVLPLLGIWTLYRRYRLARPWKVQTIVVALAGVATLSPWIVRNYILFHKFIPVRSGYGLELYIGNNGYTQHWVNRRLHPNHNDAELSEYERVGEGAYMDHKMQQAKDYIRSHPAWFAWMTFRRIVYMWTGYWSFDAAYLKDEPLDPPNVFVNTTMSLLGLWGLRRTWQRDRSLGVRFAIVLFFFPLTYYFSPGNVLLSSGRSVDRSSRGRGRGRTIAAEDCRVVPARARAECCRSIAASREWGLTSNQEWRTLRVYRSARKAASRLASARF